MVGHVEAAAAPRRMMIDGDHDLRSVASNRCRNVPSKAEAVFNHPVTVSQKLHRFDPYDCGTRALLLSTQGACLLRGYRVDSGLAAGHERVGHRFAVRGPARDRAGRTVFEVVGMSNDRQCLLPILGQRWKEL